VDFRKTFARCEEPALPGRRLLRIIGINEFLGRRHVDRQLLMPQPWGVSKFIRLTTRLIDGVLSSGERLLPIVRATVESRFAIHSALGWRRAVHTLLGSMTS